ncbi:MAG: 50S ribosomal protein L31e [Desulfurococcales archaeon]|jgi:large subunit ribosomal protein L31e|nr:50S ribosomal protein L31e [Desulfurococcales archaeon]
MPKEKDEALYVIPLQRVYWGGSRRNRGRRAIRLIQEFVKRHFGAERVIIDNMVNEYILSYKIEKPPRRIAVKVIKIDEKIYKVLLAVPVRSTSK